MTTIDYRAKRDLEEKLMDEIRHEKVFSLKRLFKLIELQSLCKI